LYSWGLFYLSKLTGFGESHPVKIDRYGKFDPIKIDRAGFLRGKMRKKQWREAPGVPTGIVMGA